MIATAVIDHQCPERRGMFRESIAMSKAYAEARAPLEEN